MSHVSLLFIFNFFFFFAARSLTVRIMAGVVPLPLLRQLNMCRSVQFREVYNPSTE